MPIQLKEEAGGELVVCISGVLTKEDYDRMLPELEPILRQHGKWRVLFEMTDFHGWEPAALWEELKFDWAHFRNFSEIERCAMVGDQEWESIMATLSKPFAGAAVRYFDHTDLAGARMWLNESPHVPDPGKEARLEGRQPIVVTNHAANLDQAVDGAADRPGPNGSKQNWLWPEITIKSSA